VWTIGHSTRSAEELLAVLGAHGMEAVVDVRRFPGSRRLPQFTASALEPVLDSAGIAYHWLPSLGGRRTPHQESVNDAWRHRSFRGYADHMETEEFAGGLFELMNIAEGLDTAIMCAEVLWWRCHRRLIADLLSSLGVAVVHIRDERVSEPHRLTSPARVVNGILRYESDLATP